MIEQLKQVNKEKYDYTAFLKKFAVVKEVMKINDDEFDYIYYTYGMKLFKNKPLIEPLEYKDEKQIVEFVIAIDTSGSVQGKIVKTFLQKTYNILTNTNSFAKKVNVYIIQCDYTVQKVDKITSIQEFEKYIKNMKLYGFGGTDFRPVFEKVEELIKNKELKKLKGLIYFTDGYGTFPTKRTPYDTAFAFLKNNYTDVWVPSWAIKLILEEEEI